ncbi:MAG: hypothetical protein AAFR51_11105 [Pseudomonadota bacterium]
MGAKISSVLPFRARKPATPAIEKDELKLVADCLEALRQATPQLVSVSPETADELGTYLALAEAALRRANAEIDMAAGDED